MGTMGQRVLSTPRAVNQWWFFHFYLRGWGDVKRSHFEFFLVILCDNFDLFFFGVGAQNSLVLICSMLSCVEVCQILVNSFIWVHTGCVVFL